MINNKYKNLIIAVLLIFSLFSFNFVLAYDTNPPVPDTPIGNTYNFSKSSGLSTTGTAAGYSQGLQKLSPITAISEVIKIILSILGILFLGLMIYGGIVWMLAQGNEQEADKAKKVITASITGLLIVIVAYALSYFIVAHFTAQVLK